MHEKLQDQTSRYPDDLLQYEWTQMIYAIHRYHEHDSTDGGNIVPSLCTVSHCAKFGAKARDRTGDPRFTKAMLYQLSYFGVIPGADVRD